jgi:hypothetical protein
MGNAQVGKECQFKNNNLQSDLNPADMPVPWMQLKVATFHQ